MTTVAVRLPEEMLEALDRLVDGGRFATRTEAIKVALGALLAAAERDRIDQEIREAYRRLPQTDEELALADAATRALIAEEPW